MQNSFCRFGKSRRGFAIKHSSNMGVKGHLPHSGDVCWAPPADLGKSRWGFAIKHSSNMGVKGHLPHSGDVCWLLLQIWENLIGVWQSCILGNLG